MVEHCYILYSEKVTGQADTSLHSNVQINDLDNSCQGH